MLTVITDRERAKYAATWAREDYSQNSPGANYVDMFMRVARPHVGQSVLDVGCGAGAGSRALEARGLNVKGFDLVGRENVTEGCIWRDLRLPGHFDFAYCCDVMEHIPTQFVALSLWNIISQADRAFFSISFKRDVHGDAIRDRLHLTVESFTWWRDTFREVGTLHEARDLIGDGVFYVGR